MNFGVTQYDKKSLEEKIYLKTQRCK